MKENKRKIIALCIHCMCNMVDTRGIQATTAITIMQQITGWLAAMSECYSSSKMRKVLSKMYEIL